MGTRHDGKDDETRSAALQLRLLGAPRITLHGAPVTGLTSAKAQGLLFYLVVTGRTHTRAALAALLWGDFPQQAARGNLRKALQQLRKHLGPYLSIKRDTVALAQDADCWVDAVEFDALPRQTAATEAPARLQRAVELYRDDFLEGFYVRNAPAFERWWLSERARLRERMLNSLQTLADHRAQQGDLNSAIALTRRFLDLEPWREEAHRRLMTWLALSDQRTAALAQFETCRRVLTDELDVAPSAETVALYERIRDGALRPSPSTGPRPLDIAPQPPAFLEETAAPSTRPREPFVGREPQIARLTGFLEAALAGRGQVAFVSGEAGWGKTRLLSAFSRRAQRDHPDLIVASGICTTITGTGDPYLPFRELLRTLCADVEQAWAAGGVTRSHALRLWRFLPRMIEALVTRGRHLIDTLIPGEALLHRATAHDAVERRLLERLQELITCEPDSRREIDIDQEHILAEAADVLRAVSRKQPLLLILDDLHWADASSVGLLFHLGRQLAESPILMLGAYRPEDVALGRHPLVNVLTEFKRLFGDVWVNLDRAGGEARAFVDALLDSEPNRLREAFRARLARTTQGHPLFTVEILRAMKEQGDLHQDKSGRWVEGPTITWDALPGRVEGVIERRIARLAPRLRTALVAASVEGETFTAEALAQVCQVSEAEMLNLLSDALVRKHHLVRASEVRQVGANRLSRYRFSHHLFQKHLYQTLDPVERAYRHEAVGKALERLYRGHTETIAVQLARHFREAGRLEKAMTYLEQAGDAAARVYAVTEAVAHYDQAIALAREIEADTADLTRLYTRLGRALELDSQFERVLTTYEAMEDLAQERGDCRMELISLTARAAIQAVPAAIHDPEQARRLGERAHSLACALGDRAIEAKILWSLCLANQWAGRWREAIDCGERSLALARELDLREQLAQTLNDLGSICYLYTGHIDKAKAALREASEIWRQLDNVPMLADSLASSAAAHVFAGEYEQAIAFSEDAFQISQSIGNLWGQSYSRWKVGVAFWERGEVSRAIHAMETAIQLGEQAGFAPPQTYTRAELAVLYGDLGEVSRGLALGRQALVAGEARGYLIDRAQVLGVLAHLHLLEGDLTAAGTCIAEASHDPYRAAWPVLFVTTVLAEAELALEQRDYARCIAVTDALLTNLCQRGMQAHVPHALYLQGVALQQAGRNQAARKCLLEARATAEALGSRRTLWRILLALAQVEDDAAAAQAMRQRARQIVSAIADHIAQADLRDSFLELPDVVT